MEDSLSHLFNADLLGATNHNIFTILNSLDDQSFTFNSSTIDNRDTLLHFRHFDDVPPPPKRAKLSPEGDDSQKVSHITVERNRRKQMNENLSVLRSLMPCFYVKRGDQASIIGGVVQYIKELQQILKSLEEKKQRKIYTEVLSPRTSISSPRLPPLSPNLSLPLSPRITLPISPRTPQQGSPYKPKLPQQSHLSSTITNMTMAPSVESSLSFDCTAVTSMELVASSTSHVADVKVKFAGPNVEVKTVSHRIPGQALRIMSILEGRSLEILHASISVVDGTMLNCFTVKIGIECELSAEELAQEIQQTFTY